MPVYGTTKLADLLLARHLARVADERGWDLRSLAAHPGLTRTELFANSTVPGGGVPTRPLPPMARFLPMQEGVNLRGAEPMLVAATDPGAENGSYWGPTGWGPAGLMQVAGRPGQVRPPFAAGNVELAARFWRAAEELVGVSLPEDARPVRHSF